LENLNDLAGHPVCGMSYEGFCIDNLLAATKASVTPYTYRTHAGAEIDLMLERGGKPWMAIEIKRSTAPSLSKGFDVACNDLGISQRFVVYPGNERFPMRHGAQAMGLMELMQRLQSD
jgi:predicted AAA+ superfamily ATPase